MVRRLVKRVTIAYTGRCFMYVIRNVGTVKIPTKFYITNYTPVCCFDPATRFRSRKLYSWSGNTNNPTSTIASKGSYEWTSFLNFSSALVKIVMK